MALGAVKVLKKSSSDGLAIWVVDVVGSSSYTTGGDAFTASTIGAPSGSTIIAASVNGANTTNSPLAVYDAANGTIKCYGTAAGATGFTECTAAGNFSTHTYRVIVFLDKIG